MRNQDISESESGLGLVELIIAFFLLAVIALAILPGLMSGIRYSAQQSTVATATRQVNGLIDQVRQSPDCGSMASIVGTSATPRTFTDGRGQTFATQASIGSCSAGATTSLHITATQGSTTLVTTDALVMIPPNPVILP